MSSVIMVSVRLETAEGFFVSQEEILPFNFLPDVIGWGTRLFKMHEVTDKYPIYRECFYYWIPPKIEKG